jgi:tetratricopeptide (TPR) repeat protein
LFWSEQSVSQRDPTRSRQIERQAEGYLELGMAQQSLDALARLAAEGELGAHGWYLHGESLRALERHEEALLSLRKASQWEPGNVYAWLAIGWCAKRTGRLPEAVEAMERALAAEPREALLHYNLACYLSLSGRKEPALAHLSEAFALDPSYRARVDSEPDFDPLRSDPDFRALTGAAT